MLGWVDVLLQKGGGGGSFGTFGGLLGLIILVLDILVIIAIWKSHKTTMVKVVWTLVVICLPVLGLILYFFLGREKR